MRGIDTMMLWFKIWKIINNFDFLSFSGFYLVLCQNMALKEFVHHSQKENEVEEEDKCAEDIQCNDTIPSKAWLNLFKGPSSIINTICGWRRDMHRWHLLDVTCLRRHSVVNKNKIHKFDRPSHNTSLISGKQISFNQTITIIFV